MGSVDICQKCGGMYIVTGSKQKFCPECRITVSRESRRVCEKKRRDRLRDNPEWKARRSAHAKRVPSTRVCPTCRKSFETRDQSIYCSEACRLAAVSVPNGDEGAIPRAGKSVLSVMRSRSGLTQNAVARMAGVTQGEVSRWEKSGEIPDKYSAILDGIYKNT